MAIGLPYTVMSSQATIESGIGARDIFATLVLQNGASLYSDDLTEIVLDNPDTVAWRLNSGLSFIQNTNWICSLILLIGFVLEKCLWQFKATVHITCCPPPHPEPWSVGDSVIPGVERENGTLIAQSQHPEAVW